MATLIPALGTCVSRPMKPAARSFQVFVKAIGPVCNLECRYCYYLDKRDLYPHARSFRMDEDLLERYVAQHIEICPDETVMFSWHGGEPTMLGIDYFRRIVELQRRHRRSGQVIVNGIQSNGTLIDADWCRFLAEEKFAVALSVDGPKALHDGYRLAKGGKPTHDRVMEAYRRLASHGVQCDIACVLHDRNVAHPHEVYGYFKSIGARHVVFLPLVSRAPGGGVSAQSVPAEAFGEFLCGVFDEWIRNDMARIQVQMFEEATRPARGLDHSLCVLRKTCGELPVLEHNGDFYSCDHFVDSEHLLGNIRERSLLEVLDMPAQVRFGRMKRDALPRQCLKCNVLDYCNGGCPKDRVVTNNAGEAVNYLCPGLHRFFTHAKPYAHRFASFLQTGKPLEQFMTAMRAADPLGGSGPGRNEPCPCGSGRKYKRCCLGQMTP